jgi:hypothetical protein
MLVGVGVGGGGIPIHEGKTEEENNGYAVFKGTVA